MKVVLIAKSFIKLCPDAICNDPVCRRAGGHGMKHKDIFISLCIISINAPDKNEKK
jgi:hypothetical protein